MDSIFTREASELPYLNFPKKIAKTAKKNQKLRHSVGKLRTVGKPGISKKYKDYRN